MSETILVPGGTGTLGSALVRRLRAGGSGVRVLSRRPAPAGRGGDGPAWCTGDLRTGKGLDAALAGAGVVVHCASDPKRPAHDVEAMRTLIAAARRAGGPHLVYISIVGVDRVPMRYYRAKLACERLIEESGLPYGILRTTQFHEFIGTLADGLSRTPLALVPTGTPFQPIDVEVVAARLAELAQGTPAGRVPDLGGREVRSGAELFRSYLAAAGRRRLRVPVRVPGKAGRAMRAGHLVSDNPTDRGLTWEEYLRARFGH